MGIKTDDRKIGLCDCLHKEAELCPHCGGETGSEIGTLIIRAVGILGVVALLCLAINWERIFSEIITFLFRRRR